MNRSLVFNLIERNLSELVTRLEIRGGLNILDLHLHSETFYQHFLNLVFGWDLQNLNAVQPNAPGIDLVDTTNKIVVQVSATATKQKIESALAKDLSAFEGYTFKFIAISKNATDLRTKKYANPHHLLFVPDNDIHDVRSILGQIFAMSIERLEEVSEFLIRELKSEPDPNKMESNLATIIKILSKEDWGLHATRFETIPYDVEAKIAHNQLEDTRGLIDEHKIHYPRIDKIYAAFDRQGVNKSLSVLSGIRQAYLATDNSQNSDRRFSLTIQGVLDKIRGSQNYESMPDEELALCVEILVVDAFIRCKIFKNPSGENDAHP